MENNFVIEPLGNNHYVVSFSHPRSNEHLREIVNLYNQDKYIKFCGNLNLLLTEPKHSEAANKPYTRLYFDEDAYNIFFSEGIYAKQIINFTTIKAIFNLATTAEWSGSLTESELNALINIYTTCNDTQKEELSNIAYTVCELIDSRLN